MSFFKVTNGGGAAFSLPDLGISVGAGATSVLSDQFSVSDLYLSADLEAAIINGDLSAQIDYGTGFATIPAVDYTNRDCLAAFLNVYEITNENNNEKLVDASEVNAAGPAGAPLHIHDARYYTKAQLGATTAPSGASLIGVDNTGWTYLVGVLNVQQALAAIDGALGSAVTLDAAYTNDTDGVMNVNGSAKPLDLRSNGVNDLYLSRKVGADWQKFLAAVMGANELILGSAAVGALAAINVRVATNLIIDGDLTITGTTTDTTVNELNVTNANIRLRDGSTGIAAANSYIEVERGTSGADARLEWDEASQRWMAGLVGSMGTIGLIDKNEIVTGIWTMQGGSATDPNMYLTNKVSAPSTNLGSATQIPVAMIGNVPAYYDKTNSRNAWLSYFRQYMAFSGRDSGTNKDEYLRAGLFTSNQSSFRCLHAMKLLGLSVQAEVAATFTIRVRKNGSATNLASVSVSAATGAHDITLNVDFAAGDVIQVYLDSAGNNVSRPHVTLELAQKL